MLAEMILKVFVLEERSGIWYWIGDWITPPAERIESRLTKLKEILE